MRGRESKVSRFKRLPLTAALVACLYGTAAVAQTESEEEEGATTEGVSELERITVTGSLLRRLEYDSASPVQVVTADTSVEIGQIDTADFLQQSSVAAGSTQINNQFSGFVVEGGTGVQTVSLRGLGAQRTLVLLDGRRPGPAGTRGQVAAFDLNVIPSSILQRAEILKDGSSSIYGSDAVAGVVNLITRRSVDRSTVTASFQAPFASGGEVFQLSAATGFKLGEGDVVTAVEWFKHERMTLGDRSFFSCAQDLFTDANGNSIDREDRSILAGTALGGCSATNLYANTFIDAITGARYIPSPDGVTIGLVPGYRPRVNPTYANSPQAAFEDVLNFDFMADQDVISEQERLSLYTSLDFNFGDVNWNTKFLYNNRSTDAQRFRQFFPLVGNAPQFGLTYANSPNYVAPVPSGLAQPVMPFRFDQKIDVDYYYLTTGLEGALPVGRYWNWNVNASYSYSDGKYSTLGIVANRSGDVQFDDTAPRVDYFAPGFLGGARMNELEAVIGAWDTGKTVYDQFVVNGVLAGELFDLPAGPLGVAVGMEHRRFSIDDQPGELSRGGNLWGQSSAQVTKGKDNVSEIFAEIEIPILAGITGFEMLSLNTSGRVFDYDTVDGTDNVWKVGLNWQIVPTLRLRGTKGTSYRAPGLYELYLGNQTSFAGQLGIDPCIRWGESTNDNIRANCAAEGIPENFAGGAISATVVTGGGLGVVKPETSRATTVGLVFTPTFADFSVALDYFKFEVKDEIVSLGAASILGGCYGAPVFPNNFCTLFNRNPANDPNQPFAIDTVRSSYLNVNKQTVAGYDMLFRYDGDLRFGKLEVEGQATYVHKDEQQLFAPGVADGFNTNNRNGSISRPKLVGNIRAALRRGDWSYTWFMNYVGGTQSLTLAPETTYFGFPNAVRDIRAESKLYHGAAVRYGQSNWDILFGIRNLFDTDPPTVSSGVVSRFGNVPAFATQYDWYGRTAYARLSYRF